ncbi:MAG: general secretion pathway protein GspK [Candidatus Omnitrophica bacterium]|nr:general secretion pathway protein GspK [Candidatus Omnitrophota bacterium]
MRIFSSSNKRGAILVTTLWILSLLTILAIGIGIRVGVDIKLMSFFLNSSKAHYLAGAGLRKTIMLIEQDNDKKVDSINEQWGCGFDFNEEEYLLKEIELGDGIFTVSYKSGKNEAGTDVYIYGASDEEGRLNINKLDDVMLAKLPEFTMEIVDSIMDWRDEDDVERLEGAESDYYGELESPYSCKSAPFSAPEELMLVKGMTEEIYNGIKDIITVYPGDGDGKVNINTATEAVLAVLIGEDLEELPGKIVRYRNGDDEEPGTEDDRIFNNVEAIITQLKAPLASGGLGAGELGRLNELVVNKKCFKVNTNTFRILSRGTVGDGKVRKTVEAVVKRSDAETGILYYYEN